MQRIIRRCGGQGIAAWMLALTGCLAWSLGSQAADLAVLQQACGGYRGVYEAKAEVPLRHPSGFRMTLPGQGCVRARPGDNLEAHYLIGVTATPDTAQRGIWTGVEATHTATAMILDLATVFEQAPPATLADAQGRLGQELRALPEGALGRILPHLYRRTDPFPEPIHHPMLTAYFSLRVLEATVGEASPEARCVPFTVATEERRTGSGAFSALLGIRIPTIVLRQRFDGLLCVAPGGRGVLVSFSERKPAQDPEAEARGAERRAAGRRFLDSVAWAP